jgi:NAD(P)-dependent dehydrogenase (short-subunit alcohol dehydrogenase family)
MASDGRPKVVVITGASSGIGFATALRLADSGQQLILAARSGASLDRAASRCRAAGADVMTQSLDVRCSNEVHRLMDTVIERYGRIDAVVHCAGVAAYGRFEEVPEPVFDGVIETNVLGTANVSRASLRHFRGRQHGTLVLVGSVLGHIAAPMMSAYAVSKWGVRSLARHLIIENADQPEVHICYVAPGGVGTPIYRQAANYLGYVGRPPPPVLTPDRVARVIVRLLDRPRAHKSVGAANPVLVAAFAAVPRLFDRLAPSVFRLVAADERVSVEPGAGNVLTAVPAGDQLTGQESGAFWSIVNKLRRRAARRLSGR